MNNRIFLDLNTSNIAPGGALVVYKENRITVDECWGNFSNSQSACIDQNTIFDLASITKLYTTAIVLRMHQKSVLNIDDLMSKYLNIYHHSNLKIIDLLTHRVNFGIRLGKYREKFGMKFKNKVFDIKPPKEASKEIFYENIGFIHLGLLIEIISGKSLSENFYELFADLDLKNTHLGLVGQKDFISPPTEKTGENIIQNVTHDESARLLGGLAGNAGIFASILDLVKFGQAWLDGKIVTQDFLNEYVYKNYDQTNKSPQALGWWMRLPNVDMKLDDFYSHTGYTGGLLFIRPKKKIVGAFLCNRTYFGRDNFEHLKIWQEMVNLSENL